MARPSRGSNHVYLERVFPRRSREAVGEKGRAVERGGPAVVLNFRPPWAVGIPRRSARTMPSCVCRS
eukprot:14286238-Alexandrium_andersonii.AAC.1